MHLGRGLAALTGMCLVDQQRKLAVAEVAQLDLVVQDGQVAVYRAKVRVSFKYQSE